MDKNLQNTVQSVHDYWNSHTLGFQYVTDHSIEPGTPEFFAHIRPWMNPYKFPWIMERIEREAELPGVPEHLAKKYVKRVSLKAVKI